MEISRTLARELSREGSGKVLDGFEHDFGKVLEGFGEKFSTIFHNFLKNCDFVKYCILPRKNHYFSYVELVKIDKKN